MGEFSVEEYLRGLSPICDECGESCLQDSGVIKLADSRVIHGACYKKRLGTFKDWKRKWGSQCHGCRRPIAKTDEIQYLGIGQAMHANCYEQWLRQLEQKCGAKRLRLDVVVRLPGEEGLTAERVARRRHQALFWKTRS